MITHFKRVVEESQTPSGATIVRVLMGGLDGFEESHFLKFLSPPTSRQVAVEVRRLLQQSSPVLAPLIASEPTPIFMPKTWFGRLCLRLILLLQRWVR